ncbi:MAG: Trp family transcriptional regulator [bacterium]|nr:Trp family transcriptional regulator [bacterium]
MKKLEQFKSRAEWDRFMWDKVVEKLARAKSNREVEGILNKLLGEHERNLMLRRLTTILLIQDGLSYSQIGEVLWLSPNTISAVKKSLLSNKYYSWRRLAPKKGSPAKLALPDESIGEKFLINLGEYIANLQMGYSDPKYRWKFLRR